MAQLWKEIEPEKLSDNIWKLVGKDWMLITAGTLREWNTMTASWGTFGVLWQKQVAICFVRPTRHTFGFINRSDYYTLSFFAEEHRKTLNFCGSHSGRDTDKAKATGLVPVALEDKAVAFEQARLTLLCKKIYTHDIDNTRFLDPGIESLYPEKDYHWLYIGEIVRCMSRR